MKVLLAGGGPVARALAAALPAAGVEVVRWSRASPGPTAESPPALAVLAVSDPAIGAVAARLLDEGRLAPGAVILHTAGAVPPSLALASVRARVAGVGVLHPLLAFPRGGEVGSLAGVVMGVAGDEAGRAAALSLARALGGAPLLLEEGALPRYHAAAALAANHTLALVDAGIALLVDEGLAPAVAAAALGGLLRSAADNVAALGLPAALTGPIARGDEATVARHLAALPPAWAALYRSTGLATVEVSRRLGRADPVALDRIAALLGAPAAS